MRLINEGFMQQRPGLPIGWLGSAIDCDLVLHQRKQAKGGRNEWAQTVRVHQYGE
jgi:hypothetical protein